MLVLQDLHPTTGIEEKQIILIHLLHQTTVHHTAGNLQVLALSRVHELGYSAARLISARLFAHLSHKHTTHRHMELREVLRHQQHAT